MVHDSSRVSTDAEDAAGILRGYKERIERLEEEGGGGEESVQLYRQSQESVICSDTISISVGSAAAFEWGTSQFGFDEWEDN